MTEGRSLSSSLNRHSLELHVYRSAVHQGRDVRVVEGHVQEYGHPDDGYDDHREQAALVHGVRQTVDHV